MNKISRTFTYVWHLTTLSERYGCSKSIPTKNLNNKYETSCHIITAQTKTTQANQLYLPLLRPGISLLLAVPVRLPYLSGVYAWKHMGDVLQCHHLAVPGLWGPKWVWESIKERFRVQGFGFGVKDCTDLIWLYSEFILILDCSSSKHPPLKNTE